MSTIRVDKIMPFQSSSVEILGSFNGTYTGSFTGSFVGDGSGLTGIPGATPIETGSFATTGSNTFVGDQDIQGTLTASMQEGFTLVGGVGNISTLVATSSLGGGSLPSDVVSGSSQLTASYDERYALSGSVGGTINTGSFATTGSNTFVGNQIVSGSVDVSGSINSDGYELEGSSTTNIPALNSTFNLDLSGSGEYGGDNFIKKTLVLGDGKVLIAGRFQSIDGHTTNDIARLNSNGTIDTSFTSPIFEDVFGGGDYYGYINTFATQSDNKIVVGGNFYEVSGSAREGIARLNTDGTLDTSFAVQSWGSFGEVRDIAIQNDGKIVCVGYFTSGSRRINTDGTLDTSFNVSTGSNNPSFFNIDNFYSVALLDSGSEQAILIGGSFTQWGSFSDYGFIVKLNPSGALDSGFAGTNLDITTGNNLDRIQKIKVGDDGYIYVAGRFKDTRIAPDGRNAGFARLTTTDEGNGVGAFDTGFTTYITGSDQNSPGDKYVNDFDFYDGDKILLGGSFTTFGNPFAGITSANRFAIVRQSTGGLVSNWGSDTLSAKYNLNTGSVNSVTLLSDDNVLVGGTFTQANFTAREGLASLKLTGFGDVTTTSEYTITADSTRLLVSSSTTQFSGDVNIVGNVTASEFSGSFVGDGSGLTGVAGSINTGSLATTGSNSFVGNQVISGSITISGSISQVGIGNNNIFIGSGSGASNTAGTYNTFVGVMSGNDNTAGEANTFIGESAGLANTTAGGNTFIGAFAAIANTTGANNSVLGLYAAEANTTGYNNTFIGNSAGNQNTTGYGNTFLGRNAGSGNIVGYYNVAIGESAGSSIASNNASVFIGYNANPQANLQSNQIVIGNSATGNGSNTTTIGNSSTTATYLRGALNLTHRTSPHIMSGSLEMSGSVNVTSAVSASSFTGSFIGDGSGLTGITSTLPSDILSSSVTNFTDYSQSVDTRISSIVTGTGFATTGSNTFVGNQVITGSLTLSSSNAVDLRVVGNSVLTGSLTMTGSITIPTGSITVPGSGSFSNFVANPSTMRSIRGNGAGLFNIVEQSDGQMTFTVSKIGTRDLTGAITSNISGSTINGNFYDNTTTTSGQGRGARLSGFISGGVVTSVQIETATVSFGQEEEGQPANRQGIGYKAGDTLTVDQSLNQASGSLTITLRQQDIDTYFGVDPRVSIDYKQYGILTTRTGIISSGSISVGAGVSALGVFNGNSIAAGEDVNVTSDYSIAVGRDLYNDYNNAYANATFGLHHSSSNYAQTIVGIASRLDDAGPGAFVVGNGTTPLIGEGTLTRSNLLVAQGSKVQVTGSLDVTGSMDVDGFTILSTVSSSYNFADDAAAASGGVPLGGLYHTSGTIKIRLA
jgi:uncharacterized delta-60 repeat protein